MQRLQRLWRGEVGLARTYWLWGSLVNGVLVSLVGALLIGAIIGVTGFVFLFYVYIAFAFVYGFFIDVAIWRSAGNYEGPRGWAIAARIMVVIAVPSQIYQLLSSATNFN